MLEKSSALSERNLRDIPLKLQELLASRIKMSEFPFFSESDFDVDEIIIDWNDFLGFLDKDLPLICQDLVKNAHIFKKSRKFAYGDVIFVETLIDSFETDKYVYFYAKMKGLWDANYYRLEKLKSADLQNEIVQIPQEVYLDAKHLFLVSLYEEDDVIRKYVSMIRQFPAKFTLDIYDLRIASDLSTMKDIRIKIVKFLKYLEFIDINEIGEISFSMLKKRTESDAVKEFLENIMKATTRDELISIQTKYETLISFMDLNPPVINKINGVINRKIENIARENP